MFTLETEVQRVPGPETGGGAELSGRDPMPWDLKGRGRALPPWRTPLPKKKKKKKERKKEPHPIEFFLYNLHFRTLPPCKHKYPEQPDPYSFQYVQN